MTAMYNSRITVLEMAAKVDYTLKGFYDMLRYNKHSMSKVERGILRNKIAYLETLPHLYTPDLRDEDDDEFVKGWLDKCYKYMEARDYEVTPIDLRQHDVTYSHGVYIQRKRMEAPRVCISETNLVLGKRKREHNEIIGTCRECNSDTFLYTTGNISNGRKRRKVSKKT